MEQNNVFVITAALADPVRLSAIMYLIREPASVTEMMNELEVSQSNLSNHLAVLKKAGLVKSRSDGRRKIYELANADVAQLVELMLNLQPASPKRERGTKLIQFARTCYDHIAGKLGVALLAALIKNDAVTYADAEGEKKPGSPEIIVGPNAGVIFGRLGADLASIVKGHRKFAYGCLDWTERTPHLAGALGAALCKAFFDQEWIVRKDATRTVALTEKGRKALKEILGLDIDQQ